MYADRYQPNKVNRGSLGASVGIVGGLLTVALLSSPYIARDKGDRTIDTYWVDPAPPPPPDRTPPPKQTPHAKAAPRIDQPTTVVEVPRPADVYVAPPVARPTIDPGTLAGAGTDVAPYDPPKPPPVLVGAQTDPRYARDFQPVYPAAEQRAGREGVVTVKVLIGVDGRVRQVERVAAASDEFWRVTERQALGKWRFKPATRDGIPVESWRTMTVRFTLADEG